MAETKPEVAWHADPKRRKRIAQVTLVIALTLIFDLWSKAWAWDRLREGEPIALIEHVFYFKFGFNTGSAFSFLRDAEWSRLFFIGVTVLALGYMAWLTHKMPTKKAYGFVAVGMIAGGALGNLHDRFVRQLDVNLNGELVTRYGVVDFLQFYYNWEDGKYWPIFNVADVALVVGVGLLLIYIRYHGDEPVKEATMTQTETDEPSYSD
jgi:signal peptidase II